MPYIKCPNCKTLLTAPTSAFGREFLCESCSSGFLLDINHLARFQLPNNIRIQLLTTEGTHFTRFPVPVLIEYGYHLPPLLTDSSGQLIVTREMFSKAERDEISTGIMDYRGDYSLNRYIRCRVLSQSDALAASKARAASGWPILDFERELYGNLDTLVEAYIPIEDITQAEATIDLGKGKDVVTLALTIKLKDRGAI